jgi:hypothetical protein
MVHNYKRFVDEQDEQLIYRICSEKEKIGSWQEVADILNDLLGTEYNESKFRKQYQAFQKMLEANQEKFVDDNAQLEANKQILEMIKKERIKLQATKLSENRYDRQDSKFELFYENIADAIKRLDPPKLVRTSINESDVQYVLGLGDIHYGAKFKSVNNEYSREECKRRFGKLLGYLEDFIESESISHLKIINVADTIQGILRFTDLQINDIPVVDSVVEISRILAEFLNELSEYCTIEYYHAPQANHSQTRPLGSKASEVATEDMERIIINYISDLLSKNDRVSVISNFKSDYVDIKIFDFDCFATHGHKVKDIKGIISDMSNRNRKFYSYAFLGHTHSANEIIVGEDEFSNKEVLTIPAFIGSDPYADSLYVGSKAMAKLYMFDRKYGKIMSRNIILN